jgi:hypothetical protein
MSWRNPAGPTHESAIPSLSTKAYIREVSSPCRTDLTFALPTSMAFFKRLTWEQCPWALPPIPIPKASIISSYTNIPVDAIINAVPLGVSYNGLTNEQKANYPHLYVVFPHLRRNIKLSRDPDFTFDWHDRIVKPALDYAWQVSGLVRVHRFPSSQRMLASGRWEGGTSTENTQPPYSRFEKYLVQSNKSPSEASPQIHATRPEYHDDGSVEKEGRGSDDRARVLNGAWSEITRSLRLLYPEDEFKDFVLLAVWN